ncbi:MULTISPECIES: hypothetical protein [unclassified Actinomadura]|uniref:hypothetical protein n=1 Tax=unclassified Actinomadura TaxID=2626254 RepID=UPI0011EDD513|nr:hypothetical protein [Actinomadura sp. K4S16]
MKIILVVLLTLLTLQALAKFVAWFTVPYSSRIKRMATYYDKKHRFITVYDTVTLGLGIVIVLLAFLTGVEYLSFISGFIVGMICIQVFFHRFIHVLPEDKTPQMPTPPVKLLSYAIQAQPGLAWREIAFISILSVWSLYMLIARGLF